MYLQYLIAIHRWKLVNVRRLSTKAVQETRSSLITKKKFRERPQKISWTAKNELLNGVERV